MVNKMLESIEKLNKQSKPINIKKNKAGISLIVLVITIIVIIILAAAVILTLTNNNPIENAKQAAYVNDLASFQDELDMYKANEYARNLGDFDPAELDATGEGMYVYIPSMTGKTKYTEELAIVDGQLIYTGSDLTKKSWAAMANISDGSLPPDTTAPTVTFGTNGGTHATEVSTIVNVTDSGGVNASTLQYVWDTQNTTEPTSGWTAFASGDTLSKTGTGIYYLWVKASDTTGNNVVTKSKVFAIGDVDIPVGTIQTEHKTFSGATTGFAHNNPVIPAGFVAVNTSEASWNNLSTDWNNGLVIQAANGNQFVWVPVDGTNVVYEKWCTTNTSYASTTDDTLPTGVIDETTQIDTYKGFYIARYEAGNVSSTVVSKKGVSVWNNINYTNAKSTAQAMYTSDNVKSGLVTGTMWDTTMKWVQNSGENVTTDSRTWGNYANSISPANVGNAILRTTGYSNYWRTKNIYDLAGNTWEFINEKYSTYSIARGGSNLDDGSNCPASYRYNANNNSYINISFRITLYII